MGAMLFKRLVAGMASLKMTFDRSENEKCCLWLEQQCAYPILEGCHDRSYYPGGGIIFVLNAHLEI